MKVLSNGEHDNYIHFCGLTGLQLENLKIACCTCDRQLECMKTHSIRGADDKLPDRNEYLKSYTGSAPQSEGPEN